MKKKLFASQTGLPASRCRLRRLQAGFSLIELLVVMATFIVTSSVIANVVLLYVKSVDKTNAETAIRQSGNAVISQIAKDIRNAGNVTCPDTKTLTIVPKFTTTTTITYECDETAGNTDIKKTVTGSVAVPLIDRTKAVLVPSTCTFSCTTDPIYTVSFNLKEARRSIGLESEIPFQTSVQKRNK